MYVIFKDKRPAGNTRFTSYEKARQTLRKRLRKLTPGWYVWTTGNNPAYSFFGYEIRKV